MSAGGRTTAESAAGIDFATTPVFATLTLSATGAVFAPSVMGCFQIRLTSFSLYVGSLFNAS